MQMGLQNPISDEGTEMTEKKVALKLEDREDPLTSSLYWPFAVYINFFFYVTFCRHKK
jgi:hypothetical protein